MSILFQSSDKFENDLKSFQAKDREKIISKINFYCSGADVDPTLFRQHAYRPIQIFLPSDLKSSLYTLRINKDLRVILTLEDDPLFDQTIVTLLRVVRHDSLEKAFRGIAGSLYHGQANLGKGDQNG